LDNPHIEIRPNKNGVFALFINGKEAKDIPHALIESIDDAFECTLALSSLKIRHKTNP